MHPITNLFGTDGIRTRLGTQPLTHDALIQCGYAIGTWLIKKYGSNPHILLSHDTRESAYWIIAALQTGLLRYSITIHYADTLPTPALCKLLTLNDGLHAGIIISASHNPYHDNGLKIIDAQEGKISEDDELQISEYYHTIIKPTSYTHFGSVIPYVSAADDYAYTIMQSYESQFLAGCTIVLDCAHGATSSIAPKIFAQLGARVIPINTSPNGTNINDQCGALHPQSLQSAVLMHNADIGFAFDGDGDRVVVVTQSGMIKNGDDILALLSNHPKYAQEKIIVGTIMSNHGLFTYLQTHGKQLVRTSVGDKYVAHALKQHNALLGGEQSGHIILEDYLCTGDGIMTALRLLQTILHTGNWQLETFTKYPQILINVPIIQKKPLTDEPIAQLIMHYESQLKSGRMIIRYSGTENLLRIMVEDIQEETAQAISSNLAAELQTILQ